MNFLIKIPLQHQYSYHLNIPTIHLYMIIFALIQIVSSWNYSHHGHDWGGICAMGHKQTPININSSLVKEIKYSDSDHLELHFLFKSVKLHSEVTNTSYIIKGDMGFLKIYKYKQLWIENIKIINVHFHSPAENQLNGEELDLEMHLVMQDPKNTFTFLVFGVLFRVGNKENPFIQRVINEFSKDFYFSLEEAFPTTKVLNFYSFEGSLTTPPCSENVIWFIDDTVQEITREEFEVFNHLWKANISFADGFGNNREIQDSSDRVVKHYHDKESFLMSYLMCLLITLIYIYYVRT